MLSWQTGRRTPTPQLTAPHTPSPPAADTGPWPCPDRAGLHRDALCTPPTSEFPEAGPRSEVHQGLRACGVIRQSTLPAKAPPSTAPTSFLPGTARWRQVCNPSVPAASRDPFLRRPQMPQPRRTCLRPVWPDTMPAQEPTSPGTTGLFLPRGCPRWFPDLGSYPERSHQHSAPVSSGHFRSRIHTEAVDGQPADTFPESWPQGRRVTHPTASCQHWLPPVFFTGAVPRWC